MKKLEEAEILSGHRKRRRREEKNKDPHAENGKGKELVALKEPMDGKTCYWYRA